MCAAPSPPDQRRTVPVRLVDIPLETRMHAAHLVCRHEADEGERRLVFAAARAPSATVYWVAA